MKLQWTLILALLFALLTGIFAVINVETVHVNFLFATTDIPLILVILGSTLLGSLIVGLFGIIRQYKLQRHIRSLEKQLTELQPNVNPAIPDQESMLASAETDKHTDKDHAQKNVT